MKKSIALALSLLMVLSLAACTGGNTDPTSTSEAQQTQAYEVNPEAEAAPNVEPIPVQELATKKISELDDETIQTALQQTALAYYYKNPDTQYDLGVLTVEGKSVSAHRTADAAPENAEWDYMNYAQCSQYAYNMYWYTMGMKTIGDREVQGFRPRFLTPEYLPCVITVWDPEKGHDDFEGAYEKLANDVKPGDIFYGGGKEITGHVIIIVGDVDGDGRIDCLHDWPYEGGTLNSQEEIPNDGNQMFEKKGSILLQPLDELILSNSSSPNWGVRTEKNNESWGVYRPYLLDRAKDLTLTPATVSRLEYRGIDIHKSFGDTIYDSVGYGQEITVTETVTNHGEADYTDLEVVEYVPQGALLVSQDANATVDGKALRWKLNVKAGETATVTYTVKNYRAGGETLEFVAGRVASIPTRTASIQINESTFSAREEAIWAGVASGKVPESISVKTYEDLNYANIVYKELLGVDINFPKTVQELLDEIVEAKNLRTASEKMLVLKEEESIFSKMIVKDQIGGIYYSTGAYRGEDVHIARMQDIREGYYTPGDIFVAINDMSRTAVKSDADTEVYIYVGEGKALMNMAGASGLIKSATSIEKLMKANFVVVLRPQLALGDFGKE